MELNGYELSRSWFDFCFENPEKIKPNHTAVLFFAVEHCNRLGWKKKFGLPSSMVMEAIGIKSYNTYKKTLDELVNWGFIEMIEISKNQYSSNIVALSKNNKALDKALDKALIKHTSKQSESTSESIDSINKQYNKEQLNNKQLKKRNSFKIPNEEEVKKYISEKGYPLNATTFVNFYQSKNWMIGKNKMKDWKAAVRTWETKRQEKNQNTQPSISKNR